MVLQYDPDTREAVIFSAWGQDADWIRNIRARPALRVQIGRESVTPQQRLLSQDESLAVVAGFLRRHPRRARLATRIMGGKTGDWAGYSAAEKILDLLLYALPAAVYLAALLVELPAFARRPFPLTRRPRPHQRACVNTTHAGTCFHRNAPGPSVKRVAPVPSRLTVAGAPQWVTFASRPKPERL